MPSEPFIPAVSQCSRCEGAGDLPCPDPQCGDSTWDHECGEGTVCPDCDGRGFVATLLRPTGVAEAVATMVAMQPKSPDAAYGYFHARPLKSGGGWREKAKEVAPLLLVIERLNDDRGRAAMLGVQALAGLVHMATPLLDDPEWRELIEEVRDEQRDEG